jgi:DNA-binding transcriptional LysR family regulator
MLADPSQLRMLALVAEHGSLARAAAELRLTPGALTAQVTKAERDWGVPLVHRGPRGARLTEAGSALAKHGLAIDDACDAATADLDDLLGRTVARLRIGAFLSVALRVLPDAMTALRHRRPGSDLSIVEGTSTDLRARVTRGELDLAVVATYDDAPDLAPWLTGVPLLEDPLVVCLPAEHRLALTPPDRRVRFSQLRHEPWVAILAGETAREQFDRIAREHDLRPRVQFQTESYDVAQAMVGTGLGVAVLSRLAVRRTPGAVHRELERPRLSRQLWAVHATDSRLTPLVDELIDLLQDVCTDLRQEWRGKPLSSTD